MVPGNFFKIERWQGLPHINFFIPFIQSGRQRELVYSVFQGIQRKSVNEDLFSD